MPPPGSRVGSYAGHREGAGSARRWRVGEYPWGGRRSVRGSRTRGVRGVTHSDDSSLAQRLANKVWGARLFDRNRLPAVCVPPAGPAELSASDLGLPLLVISQFTLYANTGKVAVPPGMRRRRAPWLNRSWTGSWKRCREAGAQVETGRFGADMQVRLTNDGPITVLFEV